MPQRPARLTVVEHVYHQPEDAPAMVSESRWSAWLKTDEQPYGRREVKVGVAWQSLDTGWVKNPSLVVVENTGKEMLTLGVGDPPMPFAWIDPGRSARFTPSCPLAIDCPDGETTYSITVFPS
jgi:hypothetical protein